MINFSFEVFSPRGFRGVSSKLLSQILCSLESWEAGESCWVISVGGLQPFPCKASLEIILVSSVSSPCSPGHCSAVLLAFPVQPSLPDVHWYGWVGRDLEHMGFEQWDANALELVLCASLGHSCRLLVLCWHKHNLFQRWRVPDFMN